jgi:hypothetical protein
MFFYFHGNVCRFTSKTTTRCTTTLTWFVWWYQQHSNMDHSSKRNQFIFIWIIVQNEINLYLSASSYWWFNLWFNHLWSWFCDTFLDSLVCISTSPPWLHALIKLLQNLRHGDNLNGDSLNKFILAVSRSHLSMMDYNTTSQNFWLRCWRLLPQS